MTETLTIDKDITLNLNGKTITRTGSTGIKVAGGDVTLTGNGAVNATFPIFVASGSLVIEGGTYTSDAQTALYASANTETTIKGGTFVSESANACNIAAYGTMTIQGGTFICNATSKANYAVLANDATSNVLIEGGTFTSKRNTIGAQEGAKVKITGGSFNADQYTIVSMSDAVIDVENGTFSNTRGTDYIFYCCDGEGNPTGWIGTINHGE